MLDGECVATALLFPMERVFEDYVGRLLRRKAAHDAFVDRVELQATDQWLFEGRRVSLHPEILCECGNGRRVVLDTKWKRVYAPRDLSVVDMHQMYAYGQRYRADCNGVLVIMHASVRLHPAGDSPQPWLQLRKGEHGHNSPSQPHGHLRRHE